MLWQLRVERENLRTPALRDKLAGGRGRSRAQPVRLELEAGAAVDTPAERAAEARRQRQAEAEQEIHDGSAGQGLAGAVQDRADRSRFGQTLVNSQELKP